MHFMLSFPRGSLNCWSSIVLSVYLRVRDFFFVCVSWHFSTKSIIATSKTHIRAVIEFLRNHASVANSGVYWPHTCTMNYSEFWCSILSDDDDYSVRISTNHPKIEQYLSKWCHVVFFFSFANAPMAAKQPTTNSNTGLIKNFEQERSTQSSNIQTDTRRSTERTPTKIKRRTQFSRGSECNL